MLEYLKTQIDEARERSVTFLDFYRRLQRRGVSIMVVTAHAQDESDTTPKLLYFFKADSFSETDLGENYSYSSILNSLHITHESVVRFERCRDTMQVS